MDMLSPFDQKQLIQGIKCTKTTGRDLTRKENATLREKRYTAEENPAHLERVDFMIPHGSSHLDLTRKENATLREKRYTAEENPAHLERVDFMIPHGSSHLLSVLVWNSILSNRCTPPKTHLRTC